MRLMPPIITSHRTNASTIPLIHFGISKSLNKIKKQVHGVDLGPLKPCLPQRLFTSDKKIDLSPSIIVDDLTRVKSYLGQSEQNGDLTLIGRRQLRSNNSWMHNYQRLVKGKPRCTLMIHPTDAARYDLNEGDDALVATRVNELKVPVEITDKIMPGVISIPHGWGHNRAGTKLGIASSRPGVSANDLTDDQDVDAVSGNAVLNGVPVIIRKA